MAQDKYSEESFDFDVTNPHDAVTRYFLQYREVATDILQLGFADIADTLNCDSLRYERGDFVDEELRGRQTDLLFYIESIEGDALELYCLFEHKSQPDYGILDQLASYLERIHSSQSKKMPVLTLVLYHGEIDWNISREYANQYPAGSAQFKDELFNFKYRLLDVKSLNFGSVKLDLITQAFLYVLHSIWRMNTGAALGQYFYRPVSQPPC